MKQEQKTEPLTEETTGTVLSESGENPAGTVSEDSGNTTQQTAQPNGTERKKNPREEAYDWLIERNVTVRKMDIVLAVCGILLLLIVIFGRS